MDTNVNRQYPVSVRGLVVTERRGLRDLTVQNMDRRYSLHTDYGSYRAINGDHETINT
ncbi:hypothetical protein HLRTI_001130 [Halorhabdus tiamatea SARL4B]|uniref:Uncharacterized protein n=1 Tax=Halorhabdus tiamatea SARL4B TaxID=1033806 RepID=F7PQV3_9EURY|nr:hypothetical protein HLRTI_001130 [Halorhabdus tiamatea SARL4B]CCQ32990.1 hypothetical protein HTIA_0850 [Halorhabdus tiamatea SARL4B]